MSGALPGATLEPRHRPKAIIRTTSGKNPGIPVPDLFHSVDDLGSEGRSPGVHGAGPAGAAILLIVHPPARVDSQARPSASVTFLPSLAIF
ncbi:hypothetical protein [Streptomyces sp. NPDC058297]|uniref:hypothetical protein n=1 Tax=Streptomyces sp. NPDC058297 TaxID=3346433 RepID=UPI0036E2948C